MGYIKHKSDESVEDYLETILLLTKTLPSVRSIDIATKMNYSKPSISVAMKNLKSRGYIAMAENGVITLTEEGLRLASDTYERHTILTEWLVSLGVDRDIADADACRVEHDLSTESFEALKAYILAHQ